MSRPMILLASLCISTAASAGPWIRDAGAGWAKVGVAHFRASEGFASGRSTGLPYRSYSVETYAEVGLGGGLQLVASVPWVSATQVGYDDVRYHHQWTGDLTLEVDSRLLKDRPLAMGVHVRVPTYRRPAAYEQARGATSNQLLFIVPQFPELGDQSVDVTLKVLWGTSSGLGWWTAEGGPRLRSSGYAHGLYAATDAGLWLVPDMVALTARISANGNVFPRAPAKPSREVLSAGGGLLLGPGPGVDLSVHTVPLGRNASTGVSVHAAAFVEW